MTHVVKRPAQGVSFAKCLQHNLFILQSTKISAQFFNSPKKVNKKYQHSIQAQRNVVLCRRLRLAGSLIKLLRWTAHDSIQIRCTRIGNICTMEYNLFASALHSMLWNPYRLFSDPFQVWRCDVGRKLRKRRHWTKTDCVGARGPIQLTIRKTGIVCFVFYSRAK